MARFVSTRPVATRLVPVPMTVTVPPRTVAKERGMSSFDEATRKRRLHPFTAGIIAATMGVWSRKSEAPAMGEVMRAPT